MKKIIAILATIIVIGTVSTLLNKNTFNQNTVVNSLLPKNIGKFEILSYYDDHGGFNGDGRIYCKIKINKDQINNIIEDKYNWQKTPIKKDIIDYRQLFPEDFPLDLKNSFYYLHDFQQDKNVNDINKNGIVLKRSSYNFILVIVDIENTTLYLFKIDT